MPRESVLRFADSGTASEQLPKVIGPGDLVLVKGSAEARMEQVVAGLLPPTVDPVLARIAAAQPIMAG